jgi:Rrf2 family iron-sulfur cluster assembly transcriptional regulator
MLLINRDTDYAIRVIVYMFKMDEKTISARDISDRLDIPYPFIRKILQTLSKENILKTRRGRGGGFSLKKLPEDITTIQLVKIFQDDMDITHCIFKDNICPDIDSCILRKEVKSIEKFVKERLGNLTVEDLIGKQ